ncbi:cupin-like domain-containing protein [Novosphingobium sp. JCM 18896]|uniref:cupin-like domain-containing protein n=1 Tax=Novosphingobium sp. JCM 18896 TaxID=2989731 RepID=UPI0022221D60|nr:cupin-like domain-containing protein [Novosphingobium sp. JCM 18896]MCW1430069.1 cupin-like domain-containing protein [Novosphingobium sp. JCM 18896]
MNDFDNFMASSTSDQTFTVTSQPAAQPTPTRAPAAAPGDSLALLRREWLLDVMERQRGLSPHAATLLTAQNLGSQHFLDNFYAPSRPVLIKGAMAGWPALEKWTPDYLAQTLGDTLVEYQGGRDLSEDFETAKDRHKRTGPFSEFIELALNGGNDAYITAYNSDANVAALAPLEADLGFLDQYLTRDHGMMWIGGAGTFTPLHFDLTNNLLAQVTGSKHIVLIPPSQTRRLAHRNHVFSDVHDVTDPYWLSQYPLARDILRYELVLGPGDLLFVPIGWWHQVRSQSFSTMLTYTNFLWPNVGHENFPGN